MKCFDNKYFYMIIVYPVRGEKDDVITIKTNMHLEDLRYNISYNNEEIKSVKRITQIELIVFPHDSVMLYQLYH